MVGIFGTDGIRGKANEFPITAETFLAVGRAAGRIFARNSGEARVLIGKDTRRSCYMIENALVAGLTSVGMDVMLTGPLPTPAIGILTRSLRADLGIMISASHNPYHDNGVKFFGPDGRKISEFDQSAIEAEMLQLGSVANAHQIGCASRIEGAAERYSEFVKQTAPRQLRLDGLKVVVDAANGAAFKVAPKLIWELGAEVISIGSKPDGVNINVGCGSTAPDACQRMVRECQADLGITLDGDADRVNLIDENGQMIDGDQLLALIALRAKRENRLSGRSIVTSVMSNRALEARLADDGIDVVRTRVGDRFVSDKMREIGANIGGEQTGHIILADHASTGDGLIAALQALSEITERQIPASEVLDVFKPNPQIHRNVRISLGTNPLDTPDIREAIDSAIVEIGSRGRLVVRPSGTEPMIRIMAEGDDPSVLDRISESLGQRIMDVSAALPAKELTATPPMFRSAGHYLGNNTVGSGNFVSRTSN